MVTRRSHHIHGGERQAPVFILEVGILGHGGLLTHFEGDLPGQAGRNEAHDPEQEVEPNHEAEHARRRHVHHQFLKEHVGVSVPPGSPCPRRL